MKKILSIIFLIMFVSCAGSQVVQQCPSEDIIIMTSTGPVSISKGMIVPEFYYTVPEYKEAVRKYLERENGL